MIGTIIRHDLARPLEMIVGADIAVEDADALLESGAAEPGPEYELPPAVYLLMAVEIDGIEYPAGAMLQVGGHISEPQALVLLRGVIGGEDVASAAGGGIG